MGREVGVTKSITIWRSERDSNPRRCCLNGFQDRFSGGFSNLRRRVLKSKNRPVFRVKYNKEYNKDGKSE